MELIFNNPDVVTWSPIFSLWIAISFYLSAEYPPVPLQSIHIKLIWAFIYQHSSSTLIIVHFFFQCDWTAWETNLKVSFLWGTKFHQNTASNGNHPALSYQHSSQQTVPLPDSVMRAAARLCNRPILTSNWGLGTQIKYSQSPSLQLTCGIAISRGRRCEGSGGFPAQTCGVFLFTSFFLWLISSGRLGHLAGRCGSQVPDPILSKHQNFHHES